MVGTDVGRSSSKSLATHKTCVSSLSEPFEPVEWFDIGIIGDESRDLGCHRPSGQAKTFHREFETAKLSGHQYQCL